MDQLEIRVLGNLVVQKAGVPLAPFPTRKSESLFAYLVVHRDRLVHRDVLCGEFWGDEPDARARKALRTALWRIRSVIEGDPDDRGRFLRVEADQIGFVGAPGVWVDAWELEACVGGEESAAEELDDAAARRLGYVADLYRGDFLEGHYDEWCFLRRDWLRMAFLTALERLLDHHRARREWLAAISRARQLLRYDPLREHVHRTLMGCHHAMGDRPSALRQYAECVRLLREELDIEPMEETRVLYDLIRGDGLGAWAARVPGAFDGAQPGAATGSLLAAEVNRALEQLYLLAARLERTRSALEPEDPRARIPLA